jgi:hypothetical protein
LKVIHMDVVKVDRDVAYVAIVVHVCCKLMFPMFHLSFLDVCSSVFYPDVAYASHICCKCFIAYGLQWFSSVFHVFLQFQIHISSISSVFRYMLQVLHLNVSY